MLAGVTKRLLSLQQQLLFTRAVHRKQHIRHEPDYGEGGEYKHRKQPGKVIVPKHLCESLTRLHGRPYLYESK